MRRSLILSLLIGSSVCSAQNVTLNVDLSKPGAPLNINHFSLGQGGLSADSIFESRIPEVRALHPHLIRLFIQEYFKLMPTADRYDWTALDRSVDSIVAANAIPLMNIDFKPALLYPKVDETITDPTDYAVWEKLITAMVQHYEERHPGVDYYWEVANEPDIGELGGCPYKFSPEGYARYYEHTAAAIRKADAHAKVGGPALADPKSPIFPELLRVVSRDHLPLDFVSWHIYDDSPTRIRATIEHKKEQLREFPELHPETILDEWNMSLRNGEVDPRFQPVFVAETAWQMFDAGLDYSCYYHIRDYHVELDQFLAFMSPRGAADMAWWWNRKPQYDGLFDYQNHVRPAYFTFLLLTRLTGQRLEISSTDPRVHAFATWDPSIRKYSLLFWNFSREPIQASVHVNGAPAQLSAAVEKLDALAPSDDENIRLKPQTDIQVGAGNTEHTITIEPYGIYFWELSQKGKDD